MDYIIETLRPHLPPAALAVLRYALASLQRVVAPSIQAISNFSTTRDPSALLPLVIALGTLYLSLMSLYRTLQAGVRFTWWLTKWSMVLVCAWYLYNMMQSFGIAPTPTSRASHYSSRPPLGGAPGSRGGSWWTNLGGGAAHQQADANLMNILGEPALNLFKERVVQFMTVPVQSDEDNKVKSKRRARSNHDKKKPRPAQQSTDDPEVPWMDWVAKLAALAQAQGRPRNR